VSRRLRKGAGRRSSQSFGWSSAVERREADLFFADLVGPAGHRLVESVRGDAPSTSHHEADLFWTDLLGRKPAGSKRRRVPWVSPPFTQLPQRDAESAIGGMESVFAEQPVFESTETDDADRSSSLGEAFGSDHVRVSLRNDDGTPAAGIAFRARFRDGHIVNGTLDARGEATIPDHTHGDVQVTFPGLPAASWDISSFGGS
jgi:hypothetical protein